MVADERRRRYSRGANLYVGRRNRYDKTTTYQYSSNQRIYTQSLTLELLGWNITPVAQPKPVKALKEFQHIMIVQVLTALNTEKIVYFAKRLCEKLHYNKFCSKPPLD